jgi:hypothetical protein
MHLIKYILTAEGTQPDYVVGHVLDGGQLPNANGNPSPQDWTLIGAGNVDENNLPSNVEIIPTKQSLSDYVSSYYSGNEELGITASDYVDNLWDNFTAWL